ncbi:hypothetical protein PPL_11482 [Heterostelium album PN500]|uniref:Uncharacterized protein n=1 Tax=Heterostelium pallidum (strain ATCC 26659 / Pp 5 / PN500) TaxID=670386 RepID=D3BTI6_HETP5|nr:hypothetical protein PPL_11482 [Heterostelium album PN500]EFA75403.1 hypothetical protein PPL_11482 [Heterostelium album PN500]|eukprot:XP_020427537.1 hypothetical protein PPL_11482 [Heterostelium album PN500]
MFSLFIVLSTIYKRKLGDAEEDEYRTQMKAMKITQSSVFTIAVVKIQISNRQKEILMQQLPKESTTKPATESTKESTTTTTTTTTDSISEPSTKTKTNQQNQQNQQLFSPRIN